MEAGILTVVCPDHLLVSSDFKEFDFVTNRVVAGHDRVSVGQPLYAAGVVEQVLSEVLIVDAPDDASL